MPLPIDPICLSCGASNPPNASVCRVCGAPLEMQEFLPVKTRVGHFEIEKVLGRGGFGITYKAMDVSNGTTVALKELMPEGMASRGANGAVNIHASQVAEFEEIKSKFIAEAQLLRKITDTASTKFIDLVAQNQTLYMAMDFVEGVTLESRIASGSLLSVKETRSILRDVLGVLEEMHLLNILHRDIKPANIILQPGGAKLIDFGSGLRFQKNKTMRVTSRVLTPAYAPLELYGQNIRLSPAADLYSLAATMYEAMTGVRIPSALERANGMKIQSLSKLEPSAPEGLVTAIEKSLEIRVDARPQSVKEFRELLDAPSRQTLTTSTNPSPSSVGTPNMGTGQISSTKKIDLDAKVANYAINPFLFLFFSTFLIQIMLNVLGLTGNSARQIFTFSSSNRILSWQAFSIFVSIFQVPLGWLLVLPVRLVFDLLTRGGSSKYLQMTFYRQSMLGIYCFGTALLFMLSIRGGLQNLDFNALRIAYFFPGSLLAVLGLVASVSAQRSKPQLTARPFKVPFLGLHLVIPALIGGWFFNSSSQGSPPVTAAASSQTINASTVASRVQTPTSSQKTTSSSVVALADAVIAGNKWVCKENRGNPIPTNVNPSVKFDNGTFLIPLDDESFDVSSAIAPYLKAKVLPCSNVVNHIPKFSFTLAGDSKHLDVSTFMDWVFTQFLKFGTADPEIILVTAKPIVRAQFLEQIFYRYGGQKFLIVSTAALKPVNYATFRAAKTVFLERIITIIKQKLSTPNSKIKNLKDLDKLWRK